MNGLQPRRPLRAACAVVLTFVVSVAVARLMQFRGRFVMVTIEESSTCALTAWPLLAERLPGAFLDCAASKIHMEDPPILTGVCLGVHYSATSQGIELSESMVFSRTGRATVRLTRPLSMVTAGVEGEEVEIVDNAARVLAGDLRIEGTSGEGIVRFRYGDRAFSLRPGETFAEIRVLSPEGVRTVSESDWMGELAECVRNGYPGTRLAIANRGFWPKSGVGREAES